MRWAVPLLVCALCASAAGTHYTFYRALSSRQAGKRVLDGPSERTSVSQWNAACALLDSSLMVRCSCSVLTTRWALTTAHCALHPMTYVQFKSPALAPMSIVPVRLTYSHPQFKVKMKDTGSGMDVVKLQHDLGLVRTSSDMVLPDGAYLFQPVLARAQINTDGNVSHSAIDQLMGNDVEVFGFGATEVEPAGERLRSARLQLVTCGRDGWQNCACALGPGGSVCAGDSGGPVLYNRMLIGVTSMGPAECGEPGSTPQGATSVFTQLQPYVALLNATMHDVDSVLRKQQRRRARNSARAHAPPVTALALGAALLLLR